MVGSSMNIARSSSSMSCNKVECRSFIEDRNGVKVSFVMLLVFISIGICFAPERPHQLASICEKHNPVIACQVW